MEGERGGVAAYRESYLAVEEMGVLIMPKRKLREEGFETSAADALARMDGGPVYISIDADIGSGEEVKAVRFLDTIGLAFPEVVGLTRALGGAIATAGLEIAGLDVMEIDVHLADIPGSGDRTVEMCEAVVEEIIDAGHRI